jgi:hypothetical protein
VLIGPSDPSDILDGGSMGEHRRGELVEPHQPRHVCRMHAARAAPQSDCPRHPPSGALRRPS